MTRTGAAIAAVLLVSCGGGGGQPEISVSDAWARASLPGKADSATYFTIANRGGALDALIGVSTPLGDSSVHSSAMDNGVMRMRPARRVEIPPRSSVAFGPGGYHVMLSGLRQPLQPGSSFPMTLAFEKSGQRQVSVTVRAIGDSGAAR